MRLFQILNSLTCYPVIIYYQKSFTSKQNWWVRIIFIEILSIGIQILKIHIFCESKNYLSKKKKLQFGGQQSISESTLHMKKKAQTHNMIQGASFVTFCGNSFYMYNNHLIRKLLLRKSQSYCMTLGLILSRQFERRRSYGTT